MPERGLYADPTFWAAHASLERQKWRSEKKRVCLSPGVVRALKRARIRALVRDAMAGRLQKK